MHSSETKSLIGESDIASRFRVVVGKVAEYARYDSLAEAFAATLAAAGLKVEDRRDNARTR